MLLPAEMTVALDRAHQHRVGYSGSGTSPGTLAAKLIPLAGLHPALVRPHMVVIVTKPVQSAAAAQSGPDATPASGAVHRSWRPFCSESGRCAPARCRLSPHAARQPAHADWHGTVVGAHPPRSPTREAASKIAAHAPVRLLHRLRRKVALMHR